MSGKCPGRWFAAVAVVLAVSAVAGAQIVVTAPAAGNPANRVKAAPDYATEVLHDRCDMNERTDLGWRIFNTVEEPKSYLTNISFSGGIFSATSQQQPGGNVGDSDANISILDSAYPGAATIGKFGANYKIDASKYTVFAVRMSVNPPINAWPTGQLFWSRNTIYPPAPGGSSWSNPFWIYGGWAIYLIDLPTLGLLSGSDTWSGMLDSLRFDPVVQADKNIQIDWIRLVQNGADFRRTITWTGSGSVDIYLDDDADAGNGNLGLLAKSQTGGSYTFVVGGLAAGNYYVAIAPAGTTNYSYSAGSYAVTEQPIVRITKPSDEGSDQDFMTVLAGNPWDFSSLSDVDWTVNVHDKSIQTITYEDLAGQTYANNVVFYGVSDTSSGVGDPTVFFLNPAFRGATYKIDTSRYHNLVCKMGIAGIHSTNDGSIARVMYMRTDEHSIGENVSQDIVIRHTVPASGNWIMDKFVADLRTLPLEEGAGSPSHSGWTGTMDSFRIDPHEFSAARAFFFDDVKLTSDWRADTSFTIEWTFQDADTPSGATLALYYDTNSSGYDGTLIQSGIAVAPGSGSYSWNTTAVPGGVYYVYAVVSDPDLNQNKFYATGPLIVSHAGTPSIAVSKHALSFGAVTNGISSSPVDVLLTNAGTGTLEWSADRSADWISVTPSTGVGAGVIRIGVARTDLAAGAYAGTVTVSDPDAANSPQSIAISLNVIAAGADAAPFGSFDTPVDGAAVSSSVAVTGWALDDLEVAGVRIYRNPAEGEPTQPNGLVFIGDANFVEGARPDVETAYSSYPLRSRAGWGYMMLTNFLPNGGNGTFTLSSYATDISGHEILLGRKTITCDNIHATKPFGAIDTPTQGGTASGSIFYNFGWALTPMPKSIPIDGSTMWVWVDGLPIGHPTYNNYRVDIATLFPSYANSNGAVGYYALPTTGYTNGTHSIAWSVTDSAGAVDGIGSRFFNVLNTEASSAALQTGIAVPTHGATAGVGTLSETATAGKDLAGPVFVRRGYDPARLAEPIYPEQPGAARTVVLSELERVAIYLDPEFAAESSVDLQARGRELPAVRRSLFSAFLEFGSELRPLPIGATFDSERGVFYWQPGPGFLGEYHFTFVRRHPRGVGTKIQINIRIIPIPNLK